MWTTLTHDYVDESHTSQWVKRYTLRFNYWCGCCSFSRVWLFVTPWTAACQASLSFTIYQSLLKLKSIESVTPSNHLILCHPLLLLPSIFPSIRVFSNKSALPQVAKVLELQLQYQSSSEYSGLISFRIDWYDLLEVQGTLTSLLQHHSSKPSVLWSSTFFMDCIVRL